MANDGLETRYTRTVGTCYGGILQLRLNSHGDFKPGAKVLVNHVGDDDIIIEVDSKNVVDNYGGPLKQRYIRSICTLSRTKMVQLRFKSKVNIANGDVVEINHTDTQVIIHRIFKK